MRRPYIPIFKSLCHLVRRTESLLQINKETANSLKIAISRSNITILQKAYECDKLLTLGSYIQIIIPLDQLL